MAKSPFLEDQIDEVIDEYALALGKLAHSWNHLHEALGVLLARTMRLSFSQILPVWYSSNNDRAQRMMIRAVIDNEKTEWLTAPQKKDIKWLLDRVDSLATVRNVAIHAPCSVGISDVAKGGLRARRARVLPHYFNGNPRAADLAGKDIVKEFNWYAARAEVLKKYTHAMGAALSPHASPAIHPWPSRPLLPELG